MGYILDTSKSPAIPHTVIRGRTYYFQMTSAEATSAAYGPLVRARLSECEEEAAF